MYQEQNWIFGIRNLAEYLGMSYQTCAEYVNKSIIPARQLGNGYIFSISEINCAISGIINNYER